MKNQICALLLVLSSCLQVSPVNAQETKADKKAEKQARKDKKVEDGKSMIFPVAAPGFTPELGGLLAVGGLWSFKPGKTKYAEMQRSSMPFTVAYTTTGAVVANALLTSFWLDDKLRINGDFWFKNMPDNYWGIGYESATSVPKSDSTTAFNREWFWINPRFLFQPKEHFFVGLNLDVNSTSGTKAVNPVRFDENYRKFNNRPLNTGLGLILRYDSRDIPVNAYKGWMLDLRYTLYSEAFGGDNQYTLLFADYRRYDQLGKEGQLLATNFKLRVADGEVPYGEMSQLGTPFDLRGYTWGQYRDYSMFYFISEYRHKIYKQGSEDPSKHQVVAWVGSGIIFDHTQVFDDPNENNQWLPNFGVGYRIEVQPRMDIRLDMGIGRETTGFYFNFNQAF